ncbi:hypothetical protein [Aurantivibrio infirmus]
MFNISFQWNSENSKQSIEAQQTIYTNLANNKKLGVLFLFSMWVLLVSILTVGFQIKDYASDDTSILIALSVIFIFIPINSFINRKYSNLITAAIINETVTNSKINLTMGDSGISLKCDTGETFLEWKAVAKAFVYKNILVLNCDLHSISIPLMDCQPKILQPQLVELIEKMTGRDVVNAENF